MAEPTFIEVAELYLELRSTKNTHEKTNWQCQRDLCESASSLTNIPISRFNANDVARILFPIWVDKRETADRLRRRIASVFDLTISEELIGGNPAAAILTANKLPQRPLQRPVRRHPFMAFHRVPEFMKMQNEKGQMTARAPSLVGSSLLTPETA